MERLPEFGHFDGPEQSEIVPVCHEEVNERRKINGLRRPIGTPILKRVPSLGSVEDKGLAIAIFEVVGVAGNGEWRGDGLSRRKGSGLRVAALQRKADNSTD